MAIIRRVEEDDDGDRDYVRGVRSTASEAKIELMCPQSKCGGKVLLAIIAVG